ncbi:MAG: protein rep [Deltaproteobacteria bacterium]|nr:protein rep [Deltaproteobacteria bacterium]
MVELRSGEASRPAICGVETCGSVWSCPRCAPRVYAERRTELVGLLETVRVRREHASLWTLTVPHGRSDALSLTRRSVTRAWRRMTSGKTWRAMLDGIGAGGMVRGLEATHGRSGWHPHLHALVIHRYDVSGDEAALGHWTPAAVAALALVRELVAMRDEVDAARRAKDARRVRAARARLARRRVALRARLDEAAVALDASGVTRRGARGGLPTSREGLTVWLVARWRRACRAEGLPMPSLADGVDVRDGTHAGAYVAKLGLAWELGSPRTKLARASSSRTPAAILADSARDGTSRALWREWVAGMKGARALCWSRGLRDAYGVMVEAETPATGSATRSLIIPGATWDGWLRWRPMRLAALQVAVEAQDEAAVAASWRGCPDALRSWSWCDGEVLPDTPPVAPVAPARIEVLRAVRRAWRTSEVVAALLDGPVPLPDRARRCTVAA